MCIIFQLQRIASQAKQFSTNVTSIIENISTIFTSSYYTKPLSCVHEQKAHGLQWVGAIDKHGQRKGSICDAQGFDLKHTEASFSPNSIDSLCLRVYISYANDTITLAYAKEVTESSLHTLGSGMAMCTNPTSVISRYLGMQPTVTSLYFTGYRKIQSDTNW
jgi:hypothetical protein